MKISGATVIAALLIGCGGNVFVDNNGAGGAGSGSGGARAQSSGRTATGPVTVGPTPNSVATGPSTNASNGTMMSSMTSMDSSMVSNGSTMTTMSTSSFDTSTGDVNPSSTSNVLPDGSSGSTFPVTSGMNVSSSSGTTCVSCEQVLQGGDPSQICPGADQQQLDDLLSCACSAQSCQTRCGGNFCIDSSPSGSCNACMMSRCNVNVENCLGIGTGSESGSGSFGSEAGPVTGGSSGSGVGGFHAGSTGSGTTCLTCSQVLMNGDPSQLCPSSKSAYEAFFDCVCTTGTCSMLCGAACTGGNPSQACQSCVTAPDPMGCLDEVNACESE